MRIFKRTIAVLAFAALMAMAGLNIGLTPEDVRRIKATPEYQLQEIEYRRSL